MQVLIFSEKNYIDDTDEHMPSDRVDTDCFNKQPQSCLERLNLKGSTHGTPLVKSSPALCFVVEGNVVMQSEQFIAPVIINATHNDDAINTYNRKMLVIKDKMPYPSLVPSSASRPQNELNSGL